MSDLNNLTVQGRIVKNAEFTTTDAGLRIARFSIATNRYRKNPDGTAGEEAYFFPLAVISLSGKTPLSVLFCFIG